MFYALREWTERCFLSTSLFPFSSFILDIALIPTRLSGDDVHALYDTNVPLWPACAVA
ncbi:Uncharacterised protein [Vibrio cholerae]|nr:Uncharacterised protein [Vibrio cholerae]CSB22592.1 Uncharacterised protein [Vibrio cholerae]CSC77572.1 Uncharacterised protein [Vibrio cholerae]CSD11384.1 Uncharacterised protein [Vibrio cholerae]